MKRIVLFELAVYVIAVGLASSLWRWPVALALCYVVMSGLVLYRWHTRGDLFFFGVAFVLGPVGEAVAIHFGAWQYSKPVLLIPIWLPLLWGIAAVFMKRLSETLSEIRGARPARAAQ
jgi:hypothetical protein